MHLNKQLSEEKARGSCKHFSPHFHLSHPSMYWPALAHWGGPLAAQQRHVTLEGQDFAILPPPTIPCTHLRRSFGSSLTLHPPPLNSWFALCRSARMGPVCAGVAGATFLTFHFMRSDLVTFGSSARLRYLSLPPLPSWL